jgi:hypothetical protein
VQGPTTHQLNIKVSQSQRPLGGLTDSRKGFRQQIVKGLASAVTGTQFIGFATQFIIGQVRKLILKVIDRRSEGREFAEGASFSEAENTL